MVSFIVLSLRNFRSEFQNFGSDRYIPFAIQIFQNFSIGNGQTWNENFRFGLEFSIQLEPLRDT